MGKKRKAGPPTSSTEAAEPAAAQAAMHAAPQPAALAAPRAVHRHTDVAPTGLGQQLAAAPGRLAKGPLQELCSGFPAAKWAPPAVPRSVCPTSPAAAVELELARAAALEQLHHRLASLCAKAGLRNVPLLSFERWRFAAKWAEDEPELAGAVPEAGGSSGSGSSSGKQPGPAAAAAAVAPGGGSKLKGSAPGPGKKAGGGSSAADPVLPYGCRPPAPEPGLVSDLTRAGLAAAAAAGVAQQLAQASAEACARLAKRRHQLASGKPPSCPPLQLGFHRHSLDFKCGGRFVRISRPFYGKLARLYRAHWLGAAGSPAAAAAATCNVGLPTEAAAALLAGLEAPAGRQQQGGAQAAGGGGSTGKRGGEGGCSPALDEGSDGDSPGDGEAAGGAAAHAHEHTALCAEARIAELEAAAAAAAGTEEGGSGGGAAVRAEFHNRLFVLLLRYKSLQGAGFQAAAGPPVFKLLRERLAVGFECFASPLNAAFARFGSAFPDVDGPFGSAGSFFRLQLKHGSYEVNPPFVPALLTAAAQHMLALLQARRRPRLRARSSACRRGAGSAIHLAAESAGGALSFAVLMPGWQEVAGWQLLRASRFLRHSLLVAAADHGYCDGSSHQARDVYRQSPFDTGLLILQTSAAAARWHVGGPLLSQLQTAMAACCPSAAAAERQRKQRGQSDLEWRGLGTRVQKAPPAAGPAAAGGGAGAQPGGAPAGLGRQRPAAKVAGQQQPEQQQQPRAAERGQKAPKKKRQKPVPS